MPSFLDQINWNPDGLVPVVAQDAHSGRLLTQAWLNREALQLAVAEGRAVYWSRSRRSEAKARGSPAAEALCAHRCGAGLPIPKG